MRPSRARVCVGLALLVAMGGVAATAQTQRPPAGQRLYTAPQAARGAGIYEQRCASCHGTLSAIVPEVAALLGDHTFRNRWRGRALAELFAVIQETMPQDDPGTLSPEQTVDLVAFILEGHRLPPGETPLGADVEQLRAVTFDP